MASLLSAVSLPEVTRVAQDLLTWRRKDNRSILKPTTQLTYFTALIVAATTLSGIPFGRDPVIHRIEKSIKAAQLLHVRRQALPHGWEDLLAIHGVILAESMEYEKNRKSIEKAFFFVSYY